MPGGDKTGPLGEGPLTGRGAGFCRGNDQPGYAGRWGEGRPGGFGRGGCRGGGRGFRHQYYATGQPGWARGRWATAPDREPTEAVAAPGKRSEDALEKRLAALQSEMQDLQRQLHELKSGEK